MSLAHNNSTGKSVLLAASDDYTSLIRLASILHRAGCRVSLLSPLGIWVAQTRYVSRRIPGGRTPAEVVDALKAHLDIHRGDHDWIIPVDDLLLRVLVKRRGEKWLEDWFPVDVRGEAPELLVSKVKFHEAMRSAGVPMPRSEIVNDADEARVAAARIGYPVMLKREVGTGGAGVARAGSPDELPAALEKLKPSGPRIVQAFLPWRLGVTETLFDRGKPVCWISSYTPRSWPSQFAPSCVRQMMSHPKIEEILLRIGQSTGLHGFGGFDFLHDAQTRELLVLEMHARATAGLHLGPLVGVDFSKAIRAMLAGEHLVQRPILNGACRELPMFPQDLDRSLEQRDWPALCRWISGKNGCVDIPWSDARLLRAYVRRVWEKERKPIMPRLAWHARHPMVLPRQIGRAVAAGLSAACHGAAHTQARGPELVSWSNR